MMNIKRNKSGFTMIELMIVIAIIGIIAGMIIPTFTGYIDDTHGSACAVNRKALQAELMVQCITDGSFRDPTGARYRRIELTAEATADVCPAHGTVTAYLDVANNTVDVFCNKHITGNVTTMGDANTREKLYSALKTVTRNNIDSGAANNPASSAHTVIEELKNKGLNMTDIRIDGAPISAWLVSNSGEGKANQFYFTTCDISALAANTRVPVIEYVCSSNKFRVHEIGVIPKTSEYGTYNALNPADRKTLKGEAKSYEEAQTYYLNSTLLD